jgi:hypothetical protein
MDKKQRDVEKVLKNRAKKKAIVNGIKAERGCFYCGERDPIVLDFHHTGDKEDTISNMLATHQGLAKMMAEIEKCQVLCCNCHRKLHGGRILC